MPELPEVEVVKRSLINKTQNLIVKAVKINDGKLRYKIDRNKIKNFDLLLIFVIFFPINFDNPILSTLYLRLASLIFTFLIIKFSIFLSKDLLTTSTSGNSGI